MALSEGRKALSREIKRALSAGGLSVAAASRKMEVKPKRLYRWIKGEVSPRLDEVERLAIAIDQAIVVRVGPETTKEPPPTWARALAEETAQQVIAILAPGQKELEDDLIRRLEELLRLRDEADPVETTESGPDDATQPEQSAE